MDKWISSFIIGAILSLFLPKVPVLFCLFFGFGAGFIVLYYPLAKYISIALLGVLWINYAELNVQSPELFAHDFSLIEQRNFSVKGEIVNIPRNRQDKQAFTFKATELNDNPLSHPILLRLSWKNALQALQQGQKWHLNLRLKPAHGYGNVGGFNYRTWLRHQHIAYTGYVYNPQKEINSPNFLLDSTITFRQKLYLKASDLFYDKPLDGLVKALSFGERGDISQAQKKVLQITATGHLIAISGLHLGLIATGSFFVFSLIFKCLPLRLLPQGIKSYFVEMNSAYIAILLSLSVTCFYAYISGCSLPTLRALLMILMYWLVRFLGIKVSMKSLLLYVVFMIILLCPLSLLSISFWLSFYAVFIISLMSWRFSIHESSSKKQSLFSRIYKGFTALFYLQVTLSVMLLPLTLFLNYEFSGLTIIANMIAVPLMSLTAIPLCLLATLTLTFSPNVSLFLFDSAYFFIEVLWEVLVYLSDQSWALIPFSEFDIMVLTLTVFYFLFRLMLGINWRWFDAVIPALFVSLLFYSRYDDNEHWQINVLDVGQGLSVVIEKNNQIILYDIGASYPSGFNFVDTVVMPYLKSQGRPYIKEVMISHSDNDHAGGLPRLRILHPLLSVRANDMNLKADNFCQQRGNFIWQQLSFEFLWPLSPEQGRENDDSCVVKISDGYHSVLLPGDISSKVEQNLIASGIDIKANILIAPHHGSKTSSSAAFIDKVAPDTVVFSSGYLNHWNMPHTSVVLRYQAQGVETFNTADTGMVRFDLSKDQIKTSTFKDDLWPFWFAHE